MSDNSVRRQHDGGVFQRHFIQTHFWEASDNLEVRGWAVICCQHHNHITVFTEMVCRSGCSGLSPRGVFPVTSHMIFVSGVRLKIRERHTDRRSSKHKSNPQNLSCAAVCHVIIPAVSVCRLSLVMCVCLCALSSVSCVRLRFSSVTAPLHSWWFSLFFALFQLLHTHTQL